MINKLIFSLSHKNRMRLLAGIAYLVICSPALVAGVAIAMLWNY